MKNALFTRCTVNHCEVFTHFLRNSLRLATFQGPGSENSGATTTKTGGSDPTFSAFSRPKSFWGRSRPFFAHGRNPKSRKPHASRVLSEARTQNMTI